jgi:hypothetical protein
VAPSSFDPAGGTRGAPPAWIVTVSKLGAARGAVGPFATWEAARQWAIDAVDGDVWTFTIDPIISPVTLPAPGTERRRRHLTVVR